MRHRLKKKKKKVLNSELWDLDITICDFIIPRLKRFKEITYSYPTHDGVNSMEEWQDTIDKMIKGFEMTKTDYFFYEKEKVDGLTLKEFSEERDECLKLFANFFGDLWI